MKKPHFVSRLIGNYIILFSLMTLIYFILILLSVKLFTTTSGFFTWPATYIFCFLLSLNLTLTVNKQ